MALKQLLTDLFRAHKRIWTGIGCAILIAGCSPLTTSEGPGISQSQPVRVALFLPYGSAQPGDEIVARDLEDAARMAISDLSGASVTLTVYNTAANPTTVGAVAQKAVEDGAQIILGPVYADVAAIVGSTVASQGINVLSFSNNTSVASRNVFLLGNTFETIATRVLSYANTQGRNRIVLLSANDTAGQFAQSAVQNAARQTGVQIMQTVSYALSQNGVVQAVPEVRDAVAQTAANGIFLTSGTSGALPLFAQLLPEAGVNSQATQFMGLARWDIPVEALSLQGLQGGLFALPDPALYQRFEQKFQSIYGRTAHPLAGFGYDGIAAIGALVTSGASEFSATQLTTPSGFAGVNGIFRFRADGTNERALAVARVVDGQIQVVSPAARRFDNAGF